MSEIWELSADEVERALAVGYTQDQIDSVQSVRKANWQAIRSEVLGKLTEAEFAVYYQQRYGIDHVCTCAEDRFLGNYAQVPRCLLRFHNDIVDKIEQVLPERDSLQTAVDSLRMQVAELGAKPRA